MNAKGQCNDKRCFQCRSVSNGPESVKALPELVKAAQRKASAIRANPFMRPFPFPCNGDEFLKDWQAAEAQPTLAALSKGLAWTAQGVWDKVPESEGWQCRGGEFAARLPEASATGEYYESCQAWLAARRAALGLASEGERKHFQVTEMAAD